MEDLESTIQQILGNPQSMTQIMDLAKSFGLSPPEPSVQTVPPGEDLAPMLEILKKTAAQPQETKLLDALKPYFSPDRQKRLDRAVRIARVAQLAGSALKSMTGKE